MYDQPYNPFAKNLAVVKDYFKKPATLALAVVRAIVIVLSLIGGIIFASQIHNYIFLAESMYGQVSSWSGLPAAFPGEIFDFAHESSSLLSAGAIASSILSEIIPALIVVALFILYFKSRNADPAASPKAGATILYVFAVIELVCLILACVVMVLSFVVLFWLYFQLKAGAFSSASFTIGIPYFDSVMRELRITDPNTLLIGICISLVLGVIVMFFAFFVVINKKRFYGSIRKSIDTVELHSEGAKPFGVMCILGAIFSGFSALSLLSLLFTGTLLFGRNSAILTPLIIVAFLATVATCVALALEAKLALGYKRHIDDVKYGYSQHAAPAAAPYAPFPAGAGYANPQNRPQNNPYIKQQPSVEPEAPAANAYQDAYGTDAPAPMIPEEPVVEEPVAEEPVVEEPVAEAPAAAVPTCPACGEEVDPSAPFCGNCGHRL